MENKKRDEILEEAERKTRAKEGSGRARKTFREKLEKRLEEEERNWKKTIGRKRKTRKFFRKRQDSRRIK